MAPEVVATATRGKVEDTVFLVLPTITPAHTLVLTLLSILPAVYIVVKNPTYRGFLMSLVLCGYGSFMFGWHVHEKAILLVIIPLGLLAQESLPLGLLAQESLPLSRTFLLVSAAGHFGLFPLLTTPAETPIKVLLTLIHFLVACYFLLWNRAGRFHTLETLYLWGFGVLQALTTLYDLFPFATRYPFLPLMLTSIFCAVGVAYSWVRLCVLALRKEKA